MLTFTALARALPVALALFVAAPAAAGELDLRKLASGAWVLMGTNGNVVIAPGAQGALIVDDQRAGDYQETIAAVAKVSPAPVRYVIDTHWHLDHSGGNAAFAEAGAVIIAQRAARERLAVDQFMAAYNRTVPASPPIALPTITYDDQMELRMGEEIVLLRHTPNAHTDGDTLVKLIKANVLHMGDVYFNGLFPFIDTGSGGGITGLIAAVDVGLSMSDDQTTIVPAHGELAKKADLRAYRDMLAAVAERVRADIAAGKDLAAIQAGDPTAAYTLGGDRARFVAAIYEGLSKTG